MTKKTNHQLERDVWTDETVIARLRETLRLLRSLGRDHDLDAATSG